ncbi:SLBB domain-containing protein [Geobacter pickeringii]|uniref:Polysaccharide biosynthesis protein n=1 Tax=Geobacter pickeringii TaxID=345632 RepID=A0A0B5B8M2_9BACT|nr:SLBB domain-containing protein [Geobacter pickeringii]AJE03048.1 polysaccharide biosynthesis protein [Geobacter pickeringii]
MTKTISRIILAVFLVLIPVSLLALSVDEAGRSTTDDEGVYLGPVRTPVKKGETESKGGVQFETPLEDLRQPVEKGRELDGRDEKKPSYELELKDAKKEKGPFEKEEKPRIVLKAEPGDSLVTLSWTMVGLPRLAADEKLRFTVFYGTESGRYDKKFEVGTSADHKLRELKNNQVYFIKIQGYTRDNALTLLSSEERVIPRAEEELGSPLEQAFSRKNLTLLDKIEADPFKRELRQFGYDFFKNSLMTGVPVENMPVGEEYVLGPGDSLRIDLWGSVNARHELTVDRNGEITIPRVGSVKVWGLSYGQAREAISRAVSRYFKGYELNVTLGKLRTIQVYVVGEVEAPGTYAVSSLGTVVNALSQAGGASRNGTLRSIRLMRGGKLVQEIDLYDMFLAGDRSRDLRLQNGDTIFVPVIGPVAAVAGEVKRPAIYELKGNTSLQQILQMAGGITAAGYEGRLQVERFEGNASRIVVDYQLQGGAGGPSTQEIRDRDMVKVFPVNKALRQVVTLQGHVVRPGEYQFRQGMRLIDVLPDYTALLPESYVESVEITRLSLPDFHKEILSANLRKALAGDGTENILLHEQDKIAVFSKSEKEEKRTVSISGQVLKPGTYDYYPNMAVRDLVLLAGSPKSNAYLQSAELTRIQYEKGDARATRIEINLRKALDGDRDNNVTLQPDDVLIVRGVVNWLEANDRFVALKGEVKYPGIYSIAKGEHLSSVIARAGGFTDKAYLKGAKFTRKSVREEQQKRMDEIIARTEQDILRKQGELASLAASREELEATKAALEGLQKNLEKLKGVKAQGRVVIRLAQLGEFTGGPYDLELMGGDAIEVPQTSSVVNVLGSVFNPTSFVLMPEKDVSFYLKKAGGPLSDADENEMYVIKADGSVISKQQSSFGIRWDDDGKRWTFGGFLASRLDPGDTLVVPEKLERVAWLRTIKDITTIISQVALTAGTVFIGLK